MRLPRCYVLRNNDHRSKDIGGIETEEKQDTETPLGYHCKRIVRGENNNNMLTKNLLELD